MTPDALRKIAGKLAGPHPWGQASEYEYTLSDAEAAALLNALVEERTAYIEAIGQPMLGERRKLTWEECLVKARRQLGLDGLWPVKGE